MATLHVRVLKTGAHLSTLTVFILCSPEHATGHYPESCVRGPVPEIFISSVLPATPRFIQEGVDNNNVNINNNNYDN
jgi:hypothetical protein